LNYFIIFSAMTHTTTKPRKLLMASMVGTMIEYFDFYIYSTAAVLVFPKLFFPMSSPTAATLESLATFALAFFARPLGAALFGHFGDRIGRKATLVAALLTMGPSTVAIGLLPGYASIGVAAPLLLAIFRFGQGLGLGGEWGGAVLLAAEYAPPKKKAWYGMFPQLGAPLGFLLSNGSFLILGNFLSNDDFLNWGWRIPFIASAILVFVGLYVRLNIEETPDFQKVIASKAQVKVPMFTVFRKHTKMLVLGSLASTTTFILFYLMTVFTLSWGTSHLGYEREFFLLAQLIAILFLAIGIPISSKLADKIGTFQTLIIATVLILLFGLTFKSFFEAGNLSLTTIFLSIGLLLMGFTYGPLGTALSEIFPTAVRYSGSSLSFTFAGILGASLAPYIATSLATSYGLEYVGYYLSGAAVISLIAFFLLKKEHDKPVG
jgi:metabolite-proton symporter